MRALTAFFLILANAIAFGNAKLPNGFVNVLDVDASLKVDLMYASVANFTGRIVSGYKDNVCYLTKEAATALKGAQIRVQEHGRHMGRNLSLYLRDCYRPVKAVNDFIAWSQQKPRVDPQKNIYYPTYERSELFRLGFISSQSAHSRGSTLDLTIVEIRDEGQVLLPLDMGTEVDFFGEASATRFVGLSADVKKSRELLLNVLSESFRNYSKEWWHFSLRSEPFPNSYFDFDVQKGLR